MTALRDRKSVLRTQTAAHYQGRALCIELRADRPGELFIREARRRSGYWVPFLVIYQAGAKVMANETRAAKVAARRKTR